VVVQFRLLDLPAVVQVGQTTEYFLAGGL